MTVLDDVTRQRDAYVHALHELVGALANIQSAAQVALHREQPLDAQWVLDVTHGKFGESSERINYPGSGEYWKEVREVRALLAQVAAHGAMVPQPVHDAAEVVEDRFSNRFAQLDERRARSRALIEAWGKVVGNA